MSGWTITVKEREPTGYLEVDRTYTIAELRDLFSGGGDVVIPLLDRIEALEAACRVLGQVCALADDDNLDRDFIARTIKRITDPLAAKYIEEARNG